MKWVLVRCRVNRTSLPWLIALLLTAEMGIVEHAAAAQEAKGTVLVVTTDLAPLQDGRKIVTRVSRDTRLPILQTRGEWYFVRVFQDGRDFTGWIHQQFVRREPTTQSALSQSAAPVREPKDLQDVRALNRQGEQLIQAREYKEARSLFEKALAAHRRAVRTDDAERALLLDNLGHAYEELGQYDQARRAYEESVAIKKKVLGLQHASTANSLYALGSVYELIGEYGAARRHLEQALEIRRAVLGAKDLKTADALSSLAGVLLAQGQLATARDYYLQALAIQREKEGAQSLNSAITLNNLGVTLHTMGDLAGAQRCHEEALAIRKQQLAPRDPNVAASLNGLGAVLVAQGKFAEAKQYLEQALEIDLATQGEDNADTGAMLNALGQAHEGLGEFVTARGYYERSLAALQKSLPKNHPAIGTPLANLGLVCSVLGDFTAARSHLEEALKLKRQVWGEQHHETATVLHNLGALAMSMGDFATARRRFEQALSIRKRVLDSQHPDVASNLSALGMLRIMQTEFAEALPDLKQALDIQQRTYGENHPHTATTYNQLGALYRITGDLAQARAHYERSLAIREQVLDESHPDVANALNSLAVLLLSTGDYATARTHLARSLAIHKRTIGEHHPNTAMLYHNLATLNAAVGDWDAAATMADRARRIARRHTMRVLPTLSEEEQLRVLDAFAVNAKHAFSLALRQHDHPAIVAKSAEWLINGKASSQEALALRQKLIRSTDENLTRQLQEVRSQIAALSVRGSTIDYSQRIAVLREQEETLVRQAGERLLGMDAQADRWIPLDEIRNQLDADQVHINIARFEVFDWEAQGIRPWRPARYVAWLIPSANKGKVKLIDLGEADAIDRAVSQARQSLQAIASAGTLEDESASERQVRESLRRLAALVLDPLLPHLEVADRLVLSPDGMLWLVPWAALPLDERKYALERYELSFVVSGRELAQPTPPSVESGPALVLADPDFDSASPGNNRRVPISNAEKSLQRGGGLAELPRFARLPATAAEANAIRPNIEHYTGKTSRIYLGAEACENVAQSVKSPQVLAFSTHGFFLEDRKSSPQQDAALQDLNQLAFPLIKDKHGENPLLRCGLALAGSNRRDIESEDDDGVLTGLEIVNIDLRGTELVVLSACETGVGEVRNGEGVAGLRQAFQLAGAQAVVASLWSVPDLETARLMKSFFEHLAAGKSKAAALRAAQRERLESRRERFDAAHPFYWAAFTVTGR